MAGVSGTTLFHHRFGAVVGGLHTVKSAVRLPYLGQQGSGGLAVIVVIGAGRGPHIGVQNGEIEVSLYDQIWQAGTVLLSTVRSVGVMGDERTYEHPVALRAVTSTDAMTADWAHLPYDFMAKVSNEIINKVKGVNRVCYDISSKPPSTIEWE